MKKKNSILVFSGVLLILFLTQSACKHSPNELAFEQNEQIYVIDKESSGVTIFTDEGILIYSIGSPSAGKSSPASEVELANVQNIIRLLVFNNKGNISGLIWNDLNGNRFISAGEQGVQNVRVFIDTNGNNTYDPGERSALSDRNGLYTVSRIKAGKTTICIDTSTLPDGYGFTTANPITINLADNQTAYDIDFGIQDQSGKISGIIWDQTDNVPIPGVLVYLDQNDDSEPTAGEPYSVTDASGSYLIANLPGGNFKFNIDDTTVDNKYYQEPGAGTNPTIVTLLPGDSRAIDVTYVHKATISGIVLDENSNTWEYIRLFIDLNGNGVYDAGEPVAVTDQFGRYIFNNLPPGTYAIILLMPNGYTMLNSPDTITLFDGEDLANANFTTKVQPVTIASFIWNDENGNGIREEVENGLGDITVFLDTNNNGFQDSGELSTVTDTTGAYSFTGLKHGSYFIRSDDSSLLNEYIPTTYLNPVHKVLLPQETFTGAKFGYQSKLAPLHTIQYPTRLDWGMDGMLYVSDNIIGSVFIYDSTLNIKGELKNLVKPLGVITDSAGNIFVGNQGRKNIEVYDSYGNFLRSFGDGNIMSANDFAFDRDNNIYILDSTIDTILVYNQAGTPTGTTIGDSSRFDYATSIAINYRNDDTGTEIAELYAADQLNCTIHVFTLNGTYKWSIGECGSLYTTNWDGKFSGLLAVDVDQYGNIHGLDNNLNVVQVFEPQNRTFVRSYNAYPPDNENLLNLQSDISIHPSDNRVIISNIATKSVETVTTIPAP